MSDFACIRGKNRATSISLAEITQDAIDRAQAGDAYSPSILLTLNGHRDHIRQFGALLNIDQAEELTLGFLKRIVAARSAASAAKKGNGNAFEQRH